MKTVLVHLLAIRDILSYNIKGVTLFTPYFMEVNMFMKIMTIFTALLFAYVFISDYVEIETRAIRKQIKERRERNANTKKRI